MNRKEVLRLIELCTQAANGDPIATRLAIEIANALHVLSTYDEGPDLVLYYKELMVLEGHEDFTHNLHSTDRLSDSQRGFLREQWQQFRNWWSAWEGVTDGGIENLNQLPEELDWR